MPIKANPEIEAMANQLAALRGQSVEEVVAAALRAELAREPKARTRPRAAKLKPAQRAKVERILGLVRAADPAAYQGGTARRFCMTT